MAGNLLYLVLCGGIALWAMEVFNMWDALQQLVEQHYRRLRGRE